MANQKLTQLTAANTSNDSDVLYVVQGANSRKTTKQLLMASTLAVANAAQSDATQALADAAAAQSTATSAQSTASSAQATATSAQTTATAANSAAIAAQTSATQAISDAAAAASTANAAASTANAAQSTANAALPKAGGTMTGGINMGSQALTNLAAPSNSADAATKSYVDTGVSSANSAASAAQTTANAALPKAGGTMTGALNMGSQGLTNLTTPSASTDAATKGYVDTALGGKQNTIATTTGVAIALATPQEYGSYGSPESGNIAVSLTNAVRGVDQILYHDDTVAPTITVAGGTAIKFGTASYDLTKVNIIVFFWMGGTNVGYIITPAV